MSEVETSEIEAAGGSRKSAVGDSTARVLVGAVRGTIGAGSVVTVAGLSPPVNRSLAAQGP